jgi:hypothetical protein
VADAGGERVIDGAHGEIDAGMCVSSVRMLCIEEQCVDVYEIVRRR